MWELIEEYHLCFLVYLVPGKAKLSLALALSLSPSLSLFSFDLSKTTDFSFFFKFCQLSVSDTCCGTDSEREDIKERVALRRHREAKRVLKKKRGRHASCGFYLAVPQELLDELVAAERGHCLQSSRFGKNL